MKIQNAEHRAEAAELQAKALESERRALEVEFEHKNERIGRSPSAPACQCCRKSFHKLPNLDIAVYMKTATEVGGDYYDFNSGGWNTYCCNWGCDRTWYESRHNGYNN